MNQELIEYFNGDDFAASTWKKKYAAKGEKTPEDTHRRMAKEFARKEKEMCDKWNGKAEDLEDLSELGKKIFKSEGLKEDEIFKLFDHFKYVIPGGSVMASLGTGNLSSLSNCFVIESPEDSYQEIMKVRSEQVQLMKRRGGVGYDLSKLRPRGSKVNNSAKTSTGAASFMQVNSDITNEVAQNGRRGALMLTMSINHPDIEEFITKKQDLTKVTGANISVKVNDEFMEAVEEDKDYCLRWPVDFNLDPSMTESIEEYDKLVAIGEEFKPDKRVYLKKVKAKRLWDILMHCAWNTAEPGIIFETRMHDYAPDGVYDEFKMVSTNPCGEIPLPGNYDSCRLIHLNLSQMIDNPYKKEASLNKDLLYDVAYMTTFLADDLVDLEYEATSRIAEACKNDKYPLEHDLWNKIKETGLRTRRCGIGFTGLADAIAKLGLTYCSPEGNRKVEEIMKTMFEATLRAEIDLSILRGTFSGYDKTVEDFGNSWFWFLMQEYPDLFEQMKKYGRRNISWTTVAPTGTVSIMAGCSSGIEPIFLPFYERKRKCMSPDDPVDFIDKVGEKFSVFVIVHPELKRYAQDILGISYENQEHMKISEWQKIYEESPWMKSCAPDIDWHNRVELQGIVQDEFCTHSVSSTVNLLNETTEEEIKDIYIEAWKHDLKGITIYRDGCRDGVMTKMNDSKSETIEVARAPKRPKELPADFYMVRVKGERFAVIVGMFDNKPYEVFAYKMPDGSETIKNHTGKIMKMAKGHYKFVSNPDSSTPITVDNLLLANENVEEKACTLYCSMLLRHGINIKYVIKTSKKVNENITSFSSALCRVLSKYLPVEKKYDTCPECGGRLVRDAGCVRCLDCTYSKCL